MRTFRVAEARSFSAPVASYETPVIQVGSVAESPPGRCCTFTAVPSTTPTRGAGCTCHSAPADETSTCWSSENARVSYVGGRVLPPAPPRPPPPPPPPPAPPVPPTG